ncbi:hypothetical protein IQ07DRAFT_646493 [Pyrenochaeta sp. DS3sAY3a]|nr:hypothetical protein IQ07DRAFT_646493 [Pyrenochaeta sp. DS3sAY3a]
MGSTQVYTSHPAHTNTPIPVTMSDILTQIQDELDRLLNMMSSDLAYIRNNAPPSVPPGQRRLDSFAEVEARTAAESKQQQSSNPSQPTQATESTQQATQPTHPAPLTQEQFQADIKLMARDIVQKEQQLELLIASLPGLKSSEKEQVERMKALEREMEELEGEGEKAVREKEVLLKMVEEKIMGVGRVR